jgi:hypothetical protein
MSNGLAIGAGISRGVSSVLTPYLMEKSQERKAEERRKKREAETARLYNAFKGRLVGPGQPSPEEAEAQLFAQGTPVKTPEAEPISPKFLTYLESFKDGSIQKERAIDALAELYQMGGLTAAQVTTLIDGTVQPSTDMTLEQLYEHGKTLGLSKEDVDEANAVQKFGDAIGLTKEAKTEMIFDRGIWQTDKDRRWKGIVNKVNQGAKDLKDFSPDEKADIINEFPDENDRRAFFDTQDNADKLYNLAQKSIQQKAAGLFMGNANLMNMALGQWRENKLDPVTRPNEVAFFDKYYSKITGELKQSILISEGLLVDNAMNQIESIQKLDDTPKSLIYMLLGADPQDFQALMENSTLIDKELKESGSTIKAKDLFDWVMQIRSMTQ